MGWGPSFQPTTLDGGRFLMRRARSEYDEAWGTFSSAAGNAHQFSEIRIAIEPCEIRLRNLKC